MRVVVEKLFLSQVLDTGDETLHGGIIHLILLNIISLNYEKEFLFYS
jgi:hypothetical protein